MVTGGGKDVVAEVGEREVDEGWSVLDVVEKGSEDTIMELRDDGEDEEVVKVKPEVVKAESNVKERSVVNDESDEVGGSVESGSSENVDVSISESETLVGIDTGNEVEGPIVMDGSENKLEVNSVGKVTGVEISVKVSGSDVGSSELSGSVSNVPVLDGNISVIVGSPVCVNVGSRLESRDMSKDGVDVRKLVGVPGENVGEVPSSLVENGGIRPVKLKGGKV